MADYFSTEGLILRAQDYKETDQLLTIYTIERGKIKALVKGVKKTTSKLRLAMRSPNQKAPHRALDINRG